MTNQETRLQRELSELATSYQTVAAALDERAAAWLAEAEDPARSPQERSNAFYQAAYNAGAARMLQESVGDLLRLLGQAG